jgi:predicted amidohydrolase YtcJ
MEREGKLKVRVSEWLAFKDPLATIEQERAQHDLHDPMLHTAMLKGFMDGSLGSRTAAMLAPYSDDPGNAGLPRYQQAKLNAMTVERTAAGPFQLGFHAIGDRANAMALDAFEAADAQASAQCSTAVCAMPSLVNRYRIEHAQVLAPGDFVRFERMGVIASMQPSHLLTDMAWAGARLGPERSKYAYAWRSMLDHHVRLAFGTDYPVESINPFRGLYAAVTRENEAGTQVFHPEQKITLDVAIEAYTVGSAFAEFEETTKGKLAPGYLADFVVVDRDVMKVGPRELLKTKVLRTVMGGRVVYAAR